MWVVFVYFVICVLYPVVVLCVSCNLLPVFNFCFSRRMEGLYKCGYCGFFISSQCDNYMEHECFKNQLEPNISMNLVADDNNILKLGKYLNEIPTKKGFP